MIFDLMKILDYILVRIPASLNSLSVCQIQLVNSSFSSRIVHTYVLQLSHCVDLGNLGALHIHP